MEEVRKRVGWVISKERPGPGDGLETAVAASELSGQITCKGHDERKDWMD